MNGKRIGYSIENLYHFHCEACGKWWSIGDWKYPGSRLTCPHCGEWAVTYPIERKDGHCSMCGREAGISWSMDSDLWFEICRDYGWDEERKDVCFECVGKMVRNSGKDRWISASFSLKGKDGGKYYG